MLAKFQYTMLLTLSTLVLSTMAAAAELAPPAPRDFKYVYTLEGHYKGGLYRVFLPLDVYSQSQQVGLKDLRIFDLHGMVMPFSISQIPQLVMDEQQSYPAYQVRVAQQGNSISLLGGGAADAPQPAAQQTSDPKDSRARREAGALLFDFGKEKYDLTDLRLIPKNTAPAGTVLSAELFTSSDMVKWHSAGMRTFGHISAEGQQVELLSLNLSTKTRYVLLVPVEGTNFFAVQGVEGTLQTGTHSYGEYSTWGTWDAEAKGYVYEVPLSLPVRTLSVELPGRTWIADVDIFTRGPKMQKTKNKQRATTAENLTWDFRSSHRFYSVEVDNRIQHAKALSFNPAWLRSAAKPNVLLRPTTQRFSQNPQLNIAYDKQELYFLAAGPGPFRLAVGCPTPLTGGADKSVGTAQEQKDAATLYLDEMQEQTVSYGSSTGERVYIWGALLLGALCMGGIALHMLRTQKNTKES